MYFQQPVCDLNSAHHENCNHGQCEADLLCHCDPGYTGATCADKTQTAAGVAADAAPTAAVLTATAVRAMSLSCIPQLAPPYASAVLQLSLELKVVSGGGGGSALPAVTMDWTITPPAGSSAPGAWLSTQHVLTAGGGGRGETVMLATNLTLPHPDLWNPNGYGALGGDVNFAAPTSHLRLNQTRVETVSANCG